MSHLDEDSFFICNICDKEYTDPRYLPCLHTFCRSCISEDIKSLGTTTKNYQCPLCKVKVPLPRNRTSDVADGFPVNDLIQNLHDAHRAKTTKNYPCQPCSRKNKNTTATRWCSSCNEALCDECIDFHQSLRRTMRHKLLDMQAIRSKSLKDIIAEPTCNKHEDEALALFCDDHGELICQTCAATDHRRCQHVMSTSDVVKMRKRDISSLGETLNNQDKRAQYLESNESDTTKAVDQHTDSVIGEIKFVRKRIDDILARCETNILADVQEITEKNKNALKRKNYEAKAIHSATSHAKNLLKYASSHGTDAHLISWYGRIDRESRGYPDRLRDVNDVHNTKIRFVVHDKLNDVIKGVNELGRLTTDRSAPLRDSKNREYWQDDRVLYQNSSRNGYPQDARIYNKVSKANDRRFRDGHSYGVWDEDERDSKNEKKSHTLSPVYTAKSPSDTQPCWLTGIDLLSNGMLAATDKNNKKIKIFNDNYMLKSERILQEIPYDLVAMEDGELAITLPEEQRIEVFATSSGINPTQTIKLGEKCFGIAYCQSRFAVTCPFSYPPSVILVSKEGQELQNVVASDGYRDRDIFMKPMYVKWDKIGSSLYISDSKRNQVVCLAGTKFKRFFYHAFNLTTPRGIAVLDDDSFYVCGWGSDNVHHVDHQGVQISELLDRHDGVIGPQNVCLSRDKNYLIVTLDPTSINSDNIYLFKI